MNHISFQCTPYNYPWYRASTFIIFRREITYAIIRSTTLAKTAATAFIWLSFYFISSSLFYHFIFLVVFHFFILISVKHGWKRLSWHLPGFGLWWIYRKRCTPTTIKTLGLHIWFNRWAIQSKFSTHVSTNAPFSTIYSIITYYTLPLLLYLYFLITCFGVAFLMSIPFRFFRLTHVLYSDLSVVSLGFVVSEDLCTL